MSENSSSIRALDGNDCAGCWPAANLSSRAKRGICFFSKCAKLATYMQWHRCEFFRNLLDGAWRRGDVRMNDLKKLIREVPDYPKPGILFYDLTTLLKDKQGFHTLIDRLCDHYKGHTIDVVAGIEARGFIFTPALPYRLKPRFVPVPKPNELPAKTATALIPLTNLTPIPK